MDWAILRILFPLFVVCAVLWVIAHLFRVVRFRRTGLGPIPFRRADSLLSPAERTFFDVLRQGVGREFHIFVKVRMEDVLTLPEETLNRQTWGSKVRQKHLDFVLCEPQSMCPVLVIELDDSSHQRADARARDAVKDAILEAAGLPILRVTARREYVVRELRELAMQKMDKTSKQRVN
jgi:very-short-patch-repair endonuclease